jgi:hypothetical protein
MTTIASFDLGIKNFAFAVRDSNSEYILLKNINLLEGYKYTISELNKSKKTRLCQLMNNLNLNSDLKQPKDIMVSSILNAVKKNKAVFDLCSELIKVLDLIDIWEQCDIFLIERQMPTNVQAFKMAHYLETYLKIKFPDKKIINYSSTFKTKKLGATKDTMTKKERKQWTVDYVRGLLINDSLEWFENLDKKDDVADAICMIESYNK